MGSGGMLYEQSWRPRRPRVFLNAKGYWEVYTDTIVQGWKKSPVTHKDSPNLRKFLETQAYDIVTIRPLPDNR